MAFSAPPGAAATGQLPADVIGSSLGVFSAEPEHVEIEFAARVVPYVRGRVWHDSQQVTELPDGRLRMTLRVSNDWALRSWILGFGADAKALSPASLVTALRDELTGAARQYGR